MPYAMADPRPDNRDNGAEAARNRAVDRVASNAIGRSNQRRRTEMTRVRTVLTLALGFAIAAAAPPFVATGMAGGHSPKCIDKSPRCVKEIHFLDTKSGCQILDPGVSTVDGTTLHLRRQVALDYSVNQDGFPGDQGWIVSTVDSDVDLGTLNGTAWGTFLKVFDSIPATLYGTYSGVVVNGLFSGTATGSGTGTFEGYLFEANVQQMPLSQLPGGDPCPSGSVTGTGQVLDSTLRIDPHANGAH